MTEKLNHYLYAPLDLAGSPAAQYVKVEEVMDVCSRLGSRLAAEAPHSNETRSVIIGVLMRLVDNGAPLERMMLYEIANNMNRDDAGP